MRYMCPRRPVCSGLNNSVRKSSKPRNGTRARGTRGFDQTEQRDGAGGSRSMGGTQRWLPRASSAFLRDQVQGADGKHGGYSGEREAVGPRKRNSKDQAREDASLGGVGVGVRRRGRNVALGPCPQVGRHCVCGRPSCRRHRRRWEGRRPASLGGTRVGL